MREAPRSLKSFLVFVILSGLFSLSMFYRVTNAVIAPNLIQDLGLNAETLGILGGAFFYSFALFQIPMGPMLDRIGPRFMISVLSLIGALGASLFAFSTSFNGALLGRILIGLGMASALMGAMKVLTLWFTASRFATLVGILYSVGTFGNAFAGSPLAYLTSIIGWRMAFYLASGITALFAFLAFWILGMEPDHEEEVSSSPSTESRMGLVQSVRLVLGSLAFWQIGIMAFFRYGTFVGLQGLWLGPYLMEIKGYSPVEAGNVLILLSLGMIVGGPISGRLSDQAFHSRKAVAVWGLSFYALSLFPLIGIPKIQNPLWYGLLFFLSGFFNSFGMLMYSHVKELFPASISGTVMTWVNFFSMAGGAIFMPALGRVIESFQRVNHKYPAEAYHFAFLICFVGMTASLIFYAFSKKER